MRFAVFTVIVILMDAASGAVLERLYFQQDSGAYADCTTILEQVRDPIVVLGSSRALHHYVPGILRDSLGASCWNSGQDGQGLLFAEAALELSFARYRPQLVLLDMNPRELERDGQSYDRMSELLPYLRRHPELQRYADLRSRFERIKCWSRVYPFNSMLLSILWHSARRAEHPSDARGYLPLQGHSPAPRLDEPEGRDPAGPIDPIKLRALAHIAAMARAHDCRVIAIVSPIARSDRARTSRTRLAALVQEAGLPFWDDAEDPTIVNNTNYFYDHAHLNEVGARKFTALVASRLLNSRRRDP
jgi:hypothetical protein